MLKQTLFDDDSEEEVAIKTENAYAKKYDTWREKEELHKLEQKYGSRSLYSDASISESDDESDEPPEVSEEMEEQFLKTLALLKTKDPRIYDPNYKFFEEKEKETVKEEKKPTLKFDDSDDDDEDDGNIFTIEKKAEILPDDISPTTNNKVGKDGKIKEYLIGKKEHIDSPIEKDLAPLKALWSDPDINEGEAFLRDYILNKTYLEDGDVGEAEDKLRDDDDLEADEQTVEEQGKFERAYNFRFEEPDHEYLKRYPRTVSSTRPKDERRARARAAVRERRDADRRRRADDIARLKALKLKEVHDKIARIKEVTGNQDLAFKEEDIEGEFDPVEHDRRMQAIFDDQYYGHEDHEKPVFPDLDDELEIENWDNYDPESEKNKHQDDDEDGPHCEDEDFNMDADYDPQQPRKNLLEQIQQTLGKKRRNRKKKSKLAKLLERDKPKFIPTEAERTYNEFMEEYYKMDCEDVIGGDLPTRFKYREVVPNDYGLTIEEILLADDKELTQWVPLKKIVKHRPDSVQKSEINTYRIKAADINLKRKVLPSLFKDLPEEPEVVVPQEGKKKKKKKNKRKEAVINETQDNDTNVLDDRAENGEETAENDEMVVKNDEVEIENDEIQVKSKKSKKKKRKHADNEQHEVGNTSSNVEDSLQNDAEDEAKQKEQETGLVIDDNEQKIEAEGKSKKKHKDIDHTNINVTNKIKENGVDKKKRKKMKNKEFNVENVQNAKPSQGSENIQQNNHKKRKLDNNSSDVPNKKTKNNQNRKKEWQNKDKFKQNKSKQQNDKSNDNPLSKLSDERLKAYGLNPKKYRSFLKYKKF